MDALAIYRDPRHDAALPLGPRDTKTKHTHTRCVSVAADTAAEETRSQS